MFRTLKSPLNVQVELTWYCPNTCRHCYNAFRHEDEPVLTLSLDEIRIIAKELIDNNIFRVVLTGGEPMAFPGLLLHTVSILKDAGIGVTINTTLIGFTPEIAVSLKELGVKTILTSLISSNSETHDYVTQNPGSWQKTVDGIRLAVLCGFSVNVNMVLTKWNISEVEDTGNFVGELGASVFGATRACAPTAIATDFNKNLISIQELRDSLNTLYLLKEKWGYRVDVFEHYSWCSMQDIQKYSNLARRKCTAGITSATIGADGDLRACGHNPKHYGNVFVDGLAGAWGKMDDWRQGLHIQKSCLKCKYVGRCTGGCPVEAENSPRGRDHHTTGPGDVISVPDSFMISADIPEGVYEFLPEVIFREEGFGGIIGSSKGEIAFVDDVTLEVARDLRKMELFNLKSVMGMGVSEEDSSVFINLLVSKNLLRKEE
jgi:radical SAM protein with 4Fe4S-binding SPASM domain